jgi:mRNA-degrading endonuclease RelE of RelBE toxin-antitoxin system
VTYAIDFEADALKELTSFRKADQVKIVAAIQLHLAQQPTRQSKSRIKHLRAGTQPTYRLRVDTFRIYYDVLAEAMLVIIYGIVDKEQSLAWLDNFAKNSAGKSE